VPHLGKPANGGGTPKGLHLNSFLARSQQVHSAGFRTGLKKADVVKSPLPSSASKARYVPLPLKHGKYIFTHAPFVLPQLCQDRQAQLQTLSRASSKFGDQASGCESAPEALEIPCDEVQIPFLRIPRRLTVFTPCALSSAAATRKPVVARAKTVTDPKKGSAFPAHLIRAERCQ
jgi:hypothetical protein